jgi:hypothetical protein
MGLWDQIMARTVAIVKQGGTATHCKYGSRLTPKIFSKIHKNKYIQKVVSLQKFTKIELVERAMTFFLSPLHGSNCSFSKCSPPPPMLTGHSKGGCKGIFYVFVIVCYVFNVF